MTDEETKFVEALMQQIEHASQDKRDVLSAKLAGLDQKLTEEDLHISDLIETIIHRARMRERDTISQLEELRSLVSHRVQVTPPPLPNMNDADRGLVRRFAPERAESMRDVVEDSMRWAN